jgi:hypothetical protein
MKHLKLRYLIVILMFSNAMFYAWGEGIFESWGFAPDNARETLRTLQQIEPDTLDITRKTP